MVFVPCMPFQSSAMFAVKTRACLSDAHNIRLDWKGLHGTNSLAYYSFSICEALHSRVGS
jgi:hypothetical protein